MVGYARKNIWYIAVVLIGYPSLVNTPIGDIDGSFKGNNTENGINLCTESKYKNNKQLAVAVCNDNFPRHVVQIEFDYFDMENSDDCIFDSLNLLLLTGDREECSGICKDNMECIQDNTEKCIRGKYCDINTCQNGGTCIKNRSNEKCYCLKGFKGDDCSQRAGEFPHNIRFISAPVDRTIKRGQGHVEECKVEVQYREEVEYNWSLNGSLIDPYSKKTGFGTHPGGILQIDDFSNEMEGQYTCVATTLVGKANHTFTYTIAEDCDVRIFTGPQSEIKNINEMTLLTCHVDPRPKEVRWKKDGVYIDFPKDYRIKKMANNNLLISNVQLSDEGVYQCEAEDYNGCYSYKEGKLQVVNLKPLEKCKFNNCLK
ncbi:uncharacterized protein LOC132723137 [Ruditapes philippinarum]|uniref:uncharacterized protein LOC132723137 n=1 Tax=Ruditapes philippinarum TaxID=129788 RepID=UPI00295BA340|nr:uncharacterized protein LOC132723137 [Ruditapes philippinarum]